MRPLYASGRALISENDGCFFVAVRTGFENGLVAQPATLNIVIHNNVNRSNFDLPGRISEIKVSIGDMVIFITLAETLFLFGQNCFQ